MRDRTLAFLLLTAWGAPAVGQEPPPPGAPPPPPVPATEAIAAGIEKLGSAEPAEREAARASLYVLGRPAGLALAEAWIVAATGKAVAVPEVTEFTAPRRRMREAWELLVDLFPGLAFSPPESIKPDILRAYVRSAPGRSGGLPPEVRVMLASGGRMVGAALRAAAAWGGPDGIAGVSRWLDNGGPDERIAAAEAAARLATPDLRARAEAFLRDGLRSDASLALRVRVARGLRVLGLYEPAIPVLAEGVRGTDESTRLAAAVELAACPSAAILALVEPWLAEKDPRIASLAAGILVALGRTDLGEAWLARAIAGADEKLRAEAAKVALSLEGGFSEAMKLQLLDAQVSEAVRRGVAFLRTTQGGDGAWSSIVASVPARGVTALALLAFLKSGVPASDESVVRALSALRVPVEPASPGGVVPQAYEQYVWAVEILAFAALESEAFRERIAERAAALVRLQTHGAWDYYGHGDGGTGPRGGDTSISQVVLLGLREAAAAGVPIPPRTWRDALTWFEKSQLKDGGWICEPYWVNKHAGAIGLVGATGMTAAGVGALLICREQLGKAVSARESAEIDAAVERGCARLGATFSARPDSRAAGLHTWYHTYYLYGVERAGTLAKRPAFGNREWYRDGASYLLAAQRADGGWAPPDDTPNLRAADASAALETSFALLFLRRATRPIITGGGRPTPPKGGGDGAAGGDAGGK